MCYYLFHRHIKKTALQGMARDEFRGTSRNLAVGWCFFFLLKRVKFRRLQVQPASDEQNNKFKTELEPGRKGPWLVGLYRG